MAAAFDPNKQFQGYQSQGTSELRRHLGSNLIAGNQRELDRMELYYLHWKFYNGFHYRELNHTLMSFNYSKAFVDKVNLFLLGSKGITFQVTSLYNDVLKPALTKPMEELIMYHWRRNNLSLTLHEILQMGSICGDVWVMPTWDNTKRFVKLNVLESRQCFPYFGTGDYNDMTGFQVRQELVDHPKQYKVFVTYYKADTVETWYQKSATLHEPESTLLSNKFKNDIHEYTKKENPYGFIPVVHIKNRPASDSYYGRSDLADIVKMNKVYNELHQEIKDIIDYHATPVTVVTGATFQGMTRALGKIWSGLPAEANVFTLSNDADLSTAQQFLDRIKVAMHEISDVPENVLGKIQSISGTSAAALQLTYQPLVQQADLKALTYGEGICDINDMIFRLVIHHDKKNPRISKFEWDDTGEIRVQPVWQYGFPTDTMNTLQEMQIKQQLNMLSREQGMNELGFNNVPDLIKKIDKERLQEAAIQGEIMGMTQPEGGFGGDQTGNEEGQTQE